MDIDGILFNELTNCPRGISFEKRVINVGLALKRELEAPNRNMNSASFIDSECESKVCELEEINENLMNVIQMCFDDACTMSGKLKKKTVLELMRTPGLNLN